MQCWWLIETKAELAYRYTKRLQAASKGSFSVIHKALTECTQENGGVTPKIEEVEKRIYELMDKQASKSEEETMTHTKLEPGKRYKITGGGYPFGMFIGSDTKKHYVFELDTGGYHSYQPINYTFTPIKEPRTLTGWVAVLGRNGGVYYSRIFISINIVKNEHPNAIDYMEITWTEKVNEDE